MMYQIEVITTSEDEETRIVRFNPKVLQQALDESFENKIQPQGQDEILCYKIGTGIYFKDTKE